MTEAGMTCASDVAEITEEAPIITSHQLELADAALSYSVTARKHEPGYQ